MRILIINTDYGPFLRTLYSADQTLAAASYETQLRRRNDSLFGVADFYSRNFIASGHEAWEVHANNAAIQSAWLRENNAPLLTKTIPNPGRLRRIANRLIGKFQNNAPTRPSPLRTSMEPLDLDLERALVEQARILRPDVILNQSVSEVEGHVLQKLRKYTRLIVGQIASPIPEEESFEAYDLVVSSLPNFVEQFRNRGISAALNRLAFEPRVLEQVGPIARDVPVSFVGSITPDHKRRFDLIEILSERMDIAIWGRLIAPETSPIRRRYREEAWGIDMYRVLARSKITINQHIDIAENCANNLRLYEATGMGTLLITDWKDNIRDMFEPGKEIVCYRTPEECIALTNYYLTHEEERAAIAAAGQQRTLRDHTFRHRTDELLSIFSNALRTGA